MVWVSVLGPVRAWHEQTEVDLGTPQQRAVLEDERLVRRVLARALAGGGAVAELFWERRVDAALTLAGPADRSASSTLLQGAGLRVLGGGSAAYVVTDLDSAADL